MSSSGAYRMSRPVEVPFDADSFGPVVVHGHTIFEMPDLVPNRIGIDTGAYKTGRLTALGLEGTERWLIEALENEIGAISVTQRSAA